MRRKMTSGKALQATCSVEIISFGPLSTLRLVPLTAITLTMDPLGTGGWGGVSVPQGTIQPQYQGLTTQRLVD